jgi:hypothetical protein
MSGRKFIHIEKELRHQDQHITDLGCIKTRQGDEIDLPKK